MCRLQSEEFLLKPLKVFILCFFLYCQCSVQLCKVLITSGKAAKIAVWRLPLPRQCLATVLSQTCASLDELFVTRY
jgi:hypothetical protein